MKVAYFDCISGISGDMILGSLVACGVPLAYLQKELGNLGVGGFTLTEETVIRSGISAVKVDVITEHQHAHRHLSHITEIISSSTLSDSVKEKAIKIFTRLAIAEAKVHGTTPEKIHFHEVGALDAIVDVVGSCIGLDYLGIERIVSTPIRLGTGSVKCAHGLMPVPVPAVVELTMGIPVVRTSIEGELTTPTGAAIITTLADSFGDLDSFSATASGYGAGTKIRDELPNLLRITVGESGGKYEEDSCRLLETNIDDMNPEIYGYISEKLFKAGAKDVYMTPIYMKKGRPATLLSILVDAISMDTVLDIVFSETTTIGVRISNVFRKKLKRESRTVETSFGPVKVKITHIDGHERCTPEFDECTRIARENNIPLITVYETIQREQNS